jgi:hypothetical protein
MKKNYLICLVFVGSLIISAFFVQKALAACPNAYGNYTLTSSCNVPDNGYMVIMNGNLTVNSGVTITLGTNSRIFFSSGYSLFLDGTIALTPSSNITKKTSTYWTARDNAATGNSCATVCSNNGQSCAGIGQDSYGTDTYYWGASVCTGSGSCSYTAGDCSTTMSDQCTTNNASCCGTDVYWTRCLCITP